MDDGSAFPLSLNKSDVVTKADVANNYPMQDSNTTVVSQSLALKGDKELADLIATKTAVRFYDAGQPLNGQANTGDIVVWTDSATTNNGNAVFNLLNAGGNAMFSSITNNSVEASYTDGSNVYTKSTPVISTDKKTITIPINKMTLNGVTVAGVNVVGSVTIPPTGNNVVVKLFVFGVAA